MITHHIHIQMCIPIASLITLCLTTSKYIQVNDSVMIQVIVISQLAAIIVQLVLHRYCLRFPFPALINILSGHHVLPNKLFSLLKPLASPKTTHNPTNY